VLVAAEIGSFYGAIVHKYPRPSAEADLAMLVLPGVVTGLVLGNLLAIPIARWIRSLFKPAAKR